MEMTQRDFDERLARVEDGSADDEDLRLIKHYRREGFEPGQTSDGSWLLGEDEEPHGNATGYAALTKRELKSELDGRKNPDDTPISYPGNANNATLIELLEQNDRERAEAEPGN
jgi:hypothetical protein